MKPYAMKSIEELEEELYQLNFRMLRESDPDKLEALDEQITEIEDMIESSQNLAKY